MKALQTFWSELIGLFVDDWLFAILLIAWIALFALGLKRVLGAPAPYVFIAGVAAVTWLAIARRARQDH